LNSFPIRKRQERQERLELHNKSQEVRPLTEAVTRRKKGKRYAIQGKKEGSYESKERSNCEGKKGYGIKRNFGAYFTSWTCSTTH
jgi:hypothetical protein